MRGSVRDAEFSEYVAARRPALRRTAYLLCGDSHRAEDLVQTTLMKVYVAWPRIRKDGRIDAYARRVMVNAHVDESRRPWRRERPVEDDGLEAFEGLRHQAAPTVSEDRDLLTEALTALPARQRAAVVLRHYWGLSVEETALDLGVAPGTVKSQTSHALRKLERALSPHNEETQGR
jgi:RNA polymerase sigma-70 factor (sigma-E family)